VRDDVVPFPQFDCLPGAQPRLEAAGIAKLADVHRRHISNVTHYVARCQLLPFDSAPLLEPVNPANLALLEFE